MEVDNHAALPVAPLFVNAMRGARYARSNTCRPVCQGAERYPEPTWGHGPTRFEEARFRGISPDEGRNTGVVRFRWCDIVLWRDPYEMVGGQNPAAKQRCGGLALCLLALNLNKPQIRASSVAPLRGDLWPRAIESLTERVLARTFSRISQGSRELFPNTQVFGTRYPA